MNRRDALALACAILGTESLPDIVDAQFDANQRLHGFSAADRRKVRDLRRHAAAGESHTAIARLFGISRSVVYHVVHRRTWAHVRDQ